MVGRKNFLKAMGAKIALLRTGAGLSQQVLAERAALTGKYVSEIERGAVNPSIDVLRCIAGALELTVARLLAGDGELDLEISALMEDATPAQRRRALAVLRALLDS